ncbi:hypothetical protein RX330_20355 [Bradyrhizobium sp. NDS-1]|uniref:hypothetical protein n=1 Tax=Bradyrhizobium sp. NDS-1 TaxID=3080014 RepID=UPI00293F585C|nr:hypothetical protein [Bradyrhizobium sp. NDS-1]WOH70652.1 hypothetical protein RX330_20355 [Bradyrhizobium sp. NDS-1]
MQREAGPLSEEAMAARRIAFTLAKAEDALGIRYAISLPLKARTDMILAGAMENPSAIDEATYSLAYMLSQPSQANVGHEAAKQQPGGPLHKPKQEPTKQ